MTTPQALAAHRRCHLSVSPTSLTAALLDRDVDVLWTAAAVRHVGAESVPLKMTAGRVELVYRHHKLAHAAAVDVENFAARPMLYNPDVPDEWMSLFYLGDIRSRREAQLVLVGS